MKGILLGLFGVFFMCNMQAQKVSGFLKNDTVPIEFANVILFKSVDSTFVNSGVSDSKGYFSLASSDQDSVFLQCSYVGYADFNSSAFIGEKNFGEITLENDNQIGEVEISFSKPFKETSAHGTTYNIGSSPVLNMGNAKKMLTKLPGVQFKQGGNISVNGKDNATVYINGKRSYLESKAVVAYLQTIPAEDILRVEIYDTPPARFDAEGNGAVINIVIRKPPLGTNGSVFLEAGYGTYYKISPAININHRTEKVNVYGGFRMRSQHTGNVQNDSSVLNMQQGHYIVNAANAFERQNIYNGKVGIDFYASDKNTFGIYYDFNIRNEDSEFNTNSTIGGDFINDYDHFNGENKFTKSNNRQNVTVDFNRKLNDSTHFSSDLVFIRLSINDDNNTHNDLYLNGASKGNSLVVSNRVSNINILAAKTDYSAKLKNKWSVEMGAKYSYIFNDNSFVAYTGTLPTNLTLDLNTTNDFKYTESITAGYFSIQKKWSEKWMSDIGFRGELTNVVGDSPTQDLKFVNNYFNLFPNISLVYKPADHHQLSLLYTQRIDRPYTTELNPFLTSINELEFESGNANLQPARDLSLIHI